MRAIILALIAAMLSSGITFLAADPRLVATSAQRAIVDTFVERYCRPDGEARFLAGEMAALSRVAIASGLGTLARLEYLRCKAGVSNAK